MCYPVSLVVVMTAVARPEQMVSSNPLVGTISTVTQQLAHQRRPAARAVSRSQDLLTVAQHSTAHSSAANLHSSCLMMLLSIFESVLT